ncbi:MAG: hypothetical protein NC253_06910 [Ruminococcus sp.]|nr:hypothetical protein [Ruminococcus sp.]MCM1380655.1 hypothetical protein [Muribaculaceae bacterium]MCM1479487.1 hypothetical protein [Muribaculaceae bacterium]
MMRITDKMSDRVFLSNNTRLRSNLLGSYDRIMSQRRFNRVSEDSINGAKAMIIRRDLRDLDIYASNLSSVKQLFHEAETNLSHVAHDDYIPVKEQLTAAVNGTHDQMELNIFSTTLDEIADDMVDALNKDFSERRIFGGTNNGTPAFEIGRYVVTDSESGEVVYPPYFYDYYVGAESTQNQVEAANEALKKLAAYNANGNTFEDAELTEIKNTLAKLGIDLHVTDGNKYSADVKTNNNRGDKITVLAYGGEPQNITCDVAENPVIAEVNTAIDNVKAAAANGDEISAADKESLAKLNLTAEINGTNAVFKDGTGIIVDMTGGLPADIADNVPKQVTVTAVSADNAAANNAMDNIRNGLGDGTVTSVDDISDADKAALEKAGLTVEITAGAAVFKDDKGNNITNIGGTMITEQIENDVKADLEMVDVPRAVTYNGIPVDFDVMHKMTAADGTRFDVQIGQKFTIRKLNDDFTWGEEKEIAPDVSAAVKGRSNSLIFPGSDPIYVDIGMGIKYDRDNDYAIDPQTALDVSFNGADIVGCGLDDDGYSKNLVQLVLEAARALRNGDQSTPNAIIDKASESNNNILIKIAELGSKQNSIEFFEQRNADSKYNLQERQNLVEGTDMETEISYWESLMAAYEASLKVGTQVIPNSIFNYI